MSAQYKTTKNLLDRASHALEALRYAEAIELLDAGLQTLGASYQSNSNLDDTGTKLTLASAEEKRGNLSVAANLKKNALASRLEMYEDVHLCR